MVGFVGCPIKEFLRNWPRTSGEVSARMSMWRPEQYQQPEACRLRGLGVKKNEAAIGLQ